MCVRCDTASALRPGLHPGRHSATEKQLQAQPLDSMLGNTGGLAPELLVLLGQIRVGSQWIAGFGQRRFF